MEGALWFVSAGIFLILFGIAIWHQRRTDHLFRHERRRAWESEEKQILPPAWRALRFRERMKKRFGFLTPPYTYEEWWIVRLVGLGIGAGYSLVTLSAWTLFITLPIGWLSGSLWLWRKERLFAQKIETEFAKGLKAFLPALDESQSVPLAMFDAVKVMDDPLREPWRQLAHALHTGKNPRDAILLFAAGIKNEHALLFSHLLLAHLETGVEPQREWLELLTNIAKEDVIRSRIHADSSASRLAAYLIHGAVPGAYLFMALGERSVMTQMIRVDPWYSLLIMAAFFASFGSFLASIVIFRDR